MGGVKPSSFANNDRDIRVGLGIGGSKLLWVSNEWGNHTLEKLG